MKYTMAFTVYTDRVIEKGYVVLYITWIIALRVSLIGGNILRPMDG